jgi:NAD(P)-dependent dehydrogenase (short-subunit alcohol dehydrogenase family)
VSLFNILDDLLDKTVIGGYDRIGYQIRRQLWDPSDLEVDLRSRTAIVTGANSGLGYVTARELARRGARVAMVCRDRERGAAARHRLREEIAGTKTPGETILSVVDMGDMDAIREFARGYPDQNDGPHILVNNAGALLNERGETAAGIERTFAVNVLGYFLLTELMLDALAKAGATGPASRVINVSSGGMYPVAIDVEDPQWQARPYDGVRAYAETKRAEVMLTELWAKRMAARGANVFLSAMHPGWADTPGVQTSLPTFRAVTQLILRSPEEGADTIIWLAAKPKIEESFDSGLFWCDRRPRPTHRMQSTRGKPADLKRYHDLLRTMTGAGEELSTDFFATLEASTQ